MVTHGVLLPRQHPGSTRTPTFGAAASPQLRESSDNVGGLLGSPFSDHLAVVCVSARKVLLKH